MKCEDSSSLSSASKLSKLNFYVIHVSLLIERAYLAYCKSKADWEDAHDVSRYVHIEEVSMCQRETSMYVSALRMIVYERFSEN